MKKIILIICAMLTLQSVMAQSHSLSGFVHVEGTTEPIPFANVALYTPHDTLFYRGATTDFEGEFNIAEVARGTYLLRITAVGYQPCERQLEVASNIRFSDLTLSRGVTLSEVRVTTRRPLFTLEGEKQVYNTLNDPSVQNGTVVDALQNSPGIEVDSEGNVRLRGVKEVSIWINGRESRMNPEALKQYLRTLPANSLKRIEVISNPSARYGGGRPVVNIVTQNKSTHNQFLSGGVNLNSRPDLSPWLSYVYGDDRWEVDLYANFSYATERSATEGSSALLTATLDTSRSDRYSRTRSERDLGSYLSLDLGYHLDSLTDLYFWGGVLPGWSSWESTDHTDRRELIYRPGDYSYTEQSRKLLGRPTFELLDGIWYEHRFDDTSGHNLMFGYYGSVGWRDSLVSLQRNYLRLPGQSVDLMEHSTGRDLFHCLEATYLRPMGRDSLSGLPAYELELVASAGWSSGSYQVDVDTLVGDDYEACDWLSSSTLATSTTASLYGGLLRRWGSFSVKAGLRGDLEQGRRRYADLPQYDYSSLIPSMVPSLHLSYSSPRQHLFALSYTRRVEVPQVGQLSGRPLYHLDSYTVGNPQLRCGSTHNLEMQWDYYRDQLGSVGLKGHLSAMTDQQGTLTDVVLEDQHYRRLVTFSQPVNIGSSWDGGVDLNLVYRPSAQLNVRLSASLFYDFIDLTYREQHYRNGMWCYAFRLNAWAKLHNQLQLFANLYYASPTQQLFLTTRSRQGVDLGVSADLFHRKLSLNLGVNDLFDSNRSGSVSSNPYLAADSETHLFSRYLSFGLTLRMGQMELERTALRERRGKR